MSLHLQGRLGVEGGWEHIDFGVDPIGVSISVTSVDTFLPAQYLVNQGLDSYQIYMDI